MYEHAAVGSALSVLIIIAFTLVFHESEPPGPAAVAASAPNRLPASRTETIPPPSPPRVAATPAAPRPNPSDSRPQLAPAPALPEPTASAVAVLHPAPPITPQPTRTEPRPATIAVSVRPTRAPDRPPVAPTPAPTPVAEPQPLPGRSAFTVIGKGERLVDVAVRVYGSAEAAARLLRANRDRLTSVDEPVGEGWLLRTP